MKTPATISPRRLRTRAFAADAAEAAGGMVLKTLVVLGLAGAVIFALSSAILASMN